jgi:hypothetical protein
MSTAVLILNSGRCSWSKCIFCGYGKILGLIPKTANINEKFDDFFKRLNCEVDEIKVFGSGSFLDEEQIPKDSRKYFIQQCKSRGIKKLIIESRPEFITKEKLKEFYGLELTVAVGLEIADDKILIKLKKGFLCQDVENAAKIIHDSGAKVRIYILVNPPFVKDAKKSLDFSVKYALKFSDSIVLINLLPHYKSDLFKMWLKGEWNFLSKEEFFKLTKKYKENKKIETDEETFRFIPRFPKELRKPLIGVGDEYLTHPYYEVWQDYLQRWYEPSEKKEILLFLPCSYKKPYSESKTHKKILEKLKSLKNYEKIHQVMISSPGIIPREFENYYPFNSYDWDEKLETEEIKRRYIGVISGRIERYIKEHKNSYKKVFCFLKYSSESYKALKIACEKLGLKFENLLKIKTHEKIKNEKNLLIRDEALNKLKEGLED